mmetsp:Transcript_5369/g.8295  ORF Transcript_5369/g.8295 Transcript_5369/m.8295 type:complete len:84 (-) Transcript_5369:457-708(-)
MRPNYYLEPYRSLKDYCSVHFRLLKEDFMAGIRQGLYAYKANKNMEFEPIRVHTSFKFESEKKKSGTNFTVYDFSVPLEIAVT